MKIYITKAGGVHSLLNSLLTEKLGGYTIEKNAFGKPYVRGNSIYFNISHSKISGCVALSDSPVGVDIEDIRGINYKRLMRSFPQCEQEKIDGERQFLVHFTAREAYIKNLGLSLFAEYSRLSFIGGYIYVDGVKQNCKISTFASDGYVLSVCGEGETDIIEL